MKPHGGCPVIGALTEFGAVIRTRPTFHGVLVLARPRVRFPPVGPYEVVAKLGAGGMGVDWLKRGTTPAPVFVSCS